MSFIDTLKSFLGFTGSKENVENVVVATAPMMETPVTAPEPLTQAPVEEVMIPEPVAHTMESDMSAEIPMVETPVETVTETALPTENK